MSTWVGVFYVMDANSTDNPAFNDAVKRINAFTKRPKDEQLLEAYGLYKQSTVARPGLLDFKGRYKWDSWNSKKGMSKETAQSMYIDLVNKLSEEFA